MLTTTNRAKGIDYNVNVVFMNKNTFVPIAPSWRVILNDVCIQIKKRGASPDARSTHEGLRIAQLVETSNAESPTYVYI